MKKSAIAKKLLCLLLVTVFSLTIVFSACEKKKEVILQVNSAKTEGVKGDEWNLSIACAPGDYEVASSHPNLVIVDRNNNDNTVKIVGTVDEDTDVTITVTAVENRDVVKTVVIKVKADVVLPEITLNVEPAVIASNQTALAAASVAPAGSGTVQIAATGNNAKYVEIVGNAIRVKADQVQNIRQDIDVTITASLEENPDISVSKTLTIKGPEAGTWIALTASTYNITPSSSSVLRVSTNALSPEYEYEIDVNHRDLVKIVKNPNDSTRATLIVSPGATVSEVTEVKIKVILLSDQTVTNEKTFNVRPAPVPTTITFDTEDNRTSLSTDTTKNDSIKLDIKVSTGDPVDVTVSNKELAEVVERSGELYLVSKGEVLYNMSVVVTATVKGQTEIKSSKTFVLTAPVKMGEINGKYNTLTQDVLDSAGNLSITATGNVVDYFEDYTAQTTTTRSYSTSVKMEDGKWIGSWKPVALNGEPVTGALELTTAYRRGTTKENSWITNRQGVQELINDYINQKVYINKHNEVTYARQTDVWGNPFLWQSGHLWNHLAYYNVNCYTYVEISGATQEEGVDYFMLNVTKDLDTYYWLTYLTYSFTPMMEDTLDSVYIKVKDNQIIGLFGRTEYLYDGGETDKEHATNCTYTELTLEFSDIGTTTVPDPTAYAAPQNADKLQAAFDYMKTATNYTFNAVDTQTGAPTVDPGEYEVSSSNGGVQTMSLSHNTTSNVGTVGWVGKVTEDQILLRKTGKYSSSLDDKLYHIEYDGYYNNKNGTYEQFAYDSTHRGFVGQRLITGNMTQVLPKWDLSPNVFKFVGQSNGNYTFELIDSEITEAVAREISMHSYATDGAPSSTVTLRITVDGEGHVVSTRFPYNISDNYIGYITTTYSNFGTTQFADEEFADYQHRELSRLWNNYEMKYYYPGHSTSAIATKASVMDILKLMYGEDKAANFPSPLAFINTFDDNVHGAFFDWNTVTNGDGSNSYKDFFSFTTSVDEYDENQRISQETFDKYVTLLMNNLNAESNKNGAGCEFKLSTKISADGIVNKSNRYSSLIDEENNFQIVIENNHTKNLWIYVYVLGDWTRASN